MSMLILMGVLRKAWIVRYIYYWLPQWLLDRAITRAGLIQSVKQVVRRTENVTEKRLKGE